MEESGSSSRVAEIIEIARVIAFALFLSLALNLLVFQVVDVRQTSMVPTLQEGDRILISKVDYRVHAPERGDIVVFRPPPPACPADASNCIPFVKRIVAVAGDVIELRDGRLIVNGAVPDEPHASGPTRAEAGGVSYPFTVPPDSVFALGDNRAFSGDSRAWGAVPRDNIFGKAYLAFWPPEHATWLLR